VIARKKANPNDYKEKTEKIENKQINESNNFEDENLKSKLSYADKDETVKSQPGRLKGFTLKDDFARGNIAIGGKTDQNEAGDDYSYKAGESNQDQLMNFEENHIFVKRNVTARARRKVAEMPYGDDYSDDDATENESNRFDKDRNFKKRSFKSKLQQQSGEQIPEQDYSDHSIEQNKRLDYSDDFNYEDFNNVQSQNNK